MTRQCPLFHETVLAEWRCVVIQVLFNASYHTVFNVDNLVCLIGNAALVGYDHDGHARFMQVFQNLHDLYGSLAVESTGRFVGKDNLGAGNQCTGNGYTLLLSAGHFVGHVVSSLFQPQAFQIFQRHSVTLPAAYSLIEERKSHILYRILEGNQIE